MTGTVIDGLISTEVQYPVPNGQPTWAHRVVTLGQTIPFRLQYEGRDEDGIAVWRVPARTWHEGDHIEIGPLPPDTRVEYWVRSHLNAEGGVHQ